MSGWMDIAGLDELAESGRKTLELPNGKPICLIRAEEGVYAISAWCSHDKAALALGTVSGGEIRCPLHGARFDLKTGRPLSLPAVRPIAVYEVRVENDRILIRV